MGNVLASVGERLRRVKARARHAQLERWRRGWVARSRRDGGRWRDSSHWSHTWWVGAPETRGVAPGRGRPGNGAGDWRRSRGLRERHLRWRTGTQERSRPYTPLMQRRDSYVLLA